MKPIPETPTTAEQWFTVAKVAEITSMGRTFLYEEMSAGRLRSKKVGGSRRIAESELVEWQARFNGTGKQTEHEEF